ncbi:MAG: hypothetical protein JJE21_10965 [Spirochaetaceae bacterium]|nr:hypothetical protein [Spirochaetaceae bacterium]
MELNKEIYFAIIGDVVDSRKIEKRNIVQRLYVEVINKINIKYSEDIASKFIITFGDSFQGLLKKSIHILQIIQEIEDSMAPYKLRFGIGIGRIDTTIILEDSSLIDGPAYHNARFAIDEVKTLKDKDKSYSATLVHSNNIILDNLINSALSICSVMKSSWTDKQKQVVDFTMNQEKTQDEIAKILHIKQPTVNRRLKSTNIYIYSQAIENINKAFELYLGENNEL